MANGVSTLGSFNLQTSRLSSLRLSLNEVQQQIATNKKSTIFGTLGTRTQEVQRLRADVDIIGSYIDGINAASVRGDIMDNALNEAQNIAIELRDTLTLTASEGNEPDIDFIKSIAQSNLEFLDQLVNTEINGRYLFAGSNISTRPFDDEARLEGNVQNQMSDWLDGTQTADQFLSNINGLQGQDLGFSLDLNSSSRVTARIDDGQDVDYTVLANEEGLAQLFRVTATLANLEFPDPNDPFVTATKEEFYDILSDLSSTLDSSITNISRSQARLAVARTDMNSAEQRHANDVVAFENIISSIEDVDLATAVAQLQQVQTQLNASYQTISIVNDLSLVNFI